MELANQIQPKNPLDDDLVDNEQSTMNLKLINNEYSIQLDSDTMKYLTMKKKSVLEDENEMRRKKIFDMKIFYENLFFFLEPIFGNDEFTDLVDYILNPVPNPPCKNLIYSICFFNFQFFLKVIHREIFGNLLNLLINLIKMTIHQVIS
jgi:hypothetical protein